MLHERHFRAMNTDVGVWLWSTAPGAPAALDAAPAFFEQVEQELSRFRPDSGLNRLNAAAGQGPQPVSTTLEAVLRLALDAARETGGLFDPTVLPALQAAGYDVSFERIDASGPHDPAAVRLGWQEVTLADGRVSLPAGMALDLGGLVKGWTVDRLAEKLSAHGPVLVDAGGDICAYGRLDGERWPVGVAEPLEEQEDLVVLELEDEAVATSSVGRRRWRRGEAWMHHLIDPRTQRPSESDVHTVTVVGPSAREAEIAAKVALLLGSAAGSGYLATRGLDGILVRHDGSLQTVGDRLKLR